MINERFDDKNIKQITDSGKSRDKNAMLNNITISEIDFLNRENGVIVGDYGISFTKNGGETWQEATIYDNDRKISFSSIDLIDKKNGWAAGYILDEGVNSPKLGQSVALKTEDGWKSWRTIFKADNEPFFSDIEFIDEISGWIVGRDGIYKTNDGGKNWYLVLRIKPE